MVLFLNYYSSTLLEFHRKVTVIYLNFQPYKRRKNTYVFWKKSRTCFSENTYMFFKLTIIHRKGRFAYLFSFF